MERDSDSRSPKDAIKKSNGTGWKIAAVAIGGLILIGALNGALNPKPAARPTGEATPTTPIEIAAAEPAIEPTPLPTATEIPTAVPTEEPTPEPPPAPSGPKVIPGITGAQVVAALRTQRFTCGSMISGQIYKALWNCEKGRVGQPGYAQVDVMGLSPTEIYAMSINVFGEPSATRPVVTAIAGIPFEGGQAAEARRWIEQNYADGAETTFGDTFVLLNGSRPAGMKILRIGQ